MAFRSAFYIVLISLAAALIYNRGFAQTLFERDLYFGLNNDPEVLRLQRFLGDEGVYAGPVTGNFFGLTLESVKKFQTLRGVTPVSGYFGPKTRVAANSRLTAPVAAPDIQTQIEALLLQIKELERQLAIAQERESAPPPPPAPIVPPPPLGPLSSNLKIDVTLQNYSSSRYTNIPLNELRLTADPNEDVAVTRIKFTNNGTLADGNFSEIKITRVRDGIIIAHLYYNYNDLLAMAANFKDKAMEIAFTADSSRPDQGLMRTGNTYNIIGSIITPNTTLKSTIQLDIVSSSDIDARDYNDLTRVADISKMNVFPITGPKVTIN